MLNKLAIEGKFLNVIKSVHEKPAAIITFVVKDNAFLLILRINHIHSHLFDSTLY